MLLPQSNHVHLTITRPKGPIFDWVLKAHCLEAGGTQAQCSTMISAGFARTRRTCGLWLRREFPTKRRKYFEMRDPSASAMRMARDGCVLHESVAPRGLAAPRADARLGPK